MSQPDFVLAVPRPTDWINANNRRRTHWRVDAQRTSDWRQAAAWAAKAAKLPALGPSRVVGELWVSARRRARIDPTNYSLTGKAAVDGLVDAGIWPDDNSEWVTGPDMRLGKVVMAEEEALVLLIWGQVCCDRACDLHGRKRVRS